MSIEGQGHFFTIYFPGFVCFVLYLAKISGERLQDHWSSGFRYWQGTIQASYAVMRQLLFHLAKRRAEHLIDIFLLL